MKDKTYHNNMNITQKLYDTDAYASEFQATVISCEKKSYIADGKNQQGYAVVLDKTLFFPEEGGQSCDKGTLNGVFVNHVAENDGVTEHYIDDEFEEGLNVCGIIDFSHRYRNMQFHSGEHVFSGLVSSLFGVKNVGFHLGKEFMTMDYEALFTKEMIDTVEDAANEVIYKNLEISAEYFPSEDLKNAEYRSKIDIDGDVRIVTIPGVDVCACCAPHVKRTGEIGVLKVADFEKYKGGTRVYVVCSADALADYRRKNDDNVMMSKLFSVKRDQVADAAKRMYDENERLRADIVALGKKYCELLAKSYTVSQKPAIIFENGIGASGMRTVANEVMKKVPLVAVFDKKEKDTYNFIMASETLNCKEILNDVSKSFTAKGGGSERMLQGTLCGTEKAVFEHFEKLDTSNF